MKNIEASKATFTDASGGDVVVEVGGERIGLLTVNADRDGVPASWSCDRALTDWIADRSPKFRHLGYKASLEDFKEVITGLLVGPADEERPALAEEATAPTFVVPEPQTEKDEPFGFLPPESEWPSNPYPRRLEEPKDNGAGHRVSDWMAFQINTLKKHFKLTYRQIREYAQIKYNYSFLHKNSVSEFFRKDTSERRAHPYQVRVRDKWDELHGHLPPFRRKERR